jgi:hypothetical protein
MLTKRENTEVYISISEINGTIMRVALKSHAGNSNNHRRNPEIKVMREEPTCSTTVRFPAPGM